jgi:hypothetical protein
MKLKNEMRKRKSDGRTKKRGFFDPNLGNYPHFTVSELAGRQDVTFWR